MRHQFVNKNLQASEGFNLNIKVFRLWLIVFIPGLTVRAGGILLPSIKQQLSILCICNAPANQLKHFRMPHYGKSMIQWQQLEWRFRLNNSSFQCFVKLLNKFIHIHKNFKLKEQPSGNVLHRGNSLRKNTLGWIDSMKISIYTTN